MLFWEGVKSPSCKTVFSSWLFCRGSGRDFSGQPPASAQTELSVDDVFVLLVRCWE